jgi:hypothetical protein
MTSSFRDSPLNQQIPSRESTFPSAQRQSLMPHNYHGDSGKIWTTSSVGCYIRRETPRLWGILCRVEKDEDETKGFVCF